MAVVLGIYDELISTFNKGLNPRNWTALPYGFLLAVFGGAIVGIVGFASAITYLLEMFPQPTQLFFVGLILGSLPVIFRAMGDTSLTVRDAVVFLVFFSFILATLFAPQYEGGFSSEAGYSLLELAFLFFSGVIAAGAMIVPGISGSLLLLLMGSYYPILEAVETRDMTVLGVVMVGAVFGIGGFSKLIGFCLSRFHKTTYFAILGLIIGSIPKLLPAMGLNRLTLLGLLALVVGTGVAYALDKIPSQASEK
jgi:putative membrane protein